MLHSVLLAAAGTGITILMTSLGAATVFLVPSGSRQRSQQLMLGLAGGVMAAATIWSLILPALAQAQGALPCWLPVSIGILLGTSFLAIMDTAVPKLQEQCAAVRSFSGESFLLLAAITLHNIPEGMAVGLAFAAAKSPSALAGAIALAIGIGLQNFPEGAAVSFPLSQQGFSKSRSFFMGVLSGIVEPLFGILVVFLAAFFQTLLPWILGFAAGAMLYVTVDELVPQSRGRAGTLGFIFGFLIMMILDVALG